MKIIVITNIITINNHDTMIRRPKLMNRGGAAEGQVWRIQEQIGGWKIINIVISSYASTTSSTPYNSRTVSYSLGRDSNYRSIEGMRACCSGLLWLKLTVPTYCSELKILSLTFCFVSMSAPLSRSMSLCPRAVSVRRWGYRRLKGRVSLYVQSFYNERQDQRTENRHHYQQQQHGWEKGKWVWSEPLIRFKYIHTLPFSSLPYNW